MGESNRIHSKKMKRSSVVWGFKMFQSSWECLDDLDARLVYEVVTKFVTGPHLWDSPILKMSCNSSEQLLR